jgi:hypothetical protein
VPDIVLGDALGKFSNVGEYLSLSLDGVKVILKVLAVAENEGGLPVDLAGQLDGLEEARETEGLHIGNEVLNIGNQEITIDGAGLDLLKAVLLDDGSGKAGKDSDGLGDIKSDGGEGEGCNYNQGEKLVHSRIL